MALVAAVDAEWGSALKVVKKFNSALRQLVVVQLGELSKLPPTALRCVAAAQKHFSLDEDARRYATVYQQLGATS